MICKIFVPITGSDESKIATDKAVETAALLNARIVAVHVLDQESLAKLQRYKIFIEEESNTFGESLRRDAEKYLEYAKTAANAFHVDIETVLLEGEPYKEIYQLVRNDPASQKFVMIAAAKNSDSFISSFGVLEKKILRSGLPVMVAGDK
ncbi:MAG: universal stress protein [Brevinema sp.]